MYAGEGSAEAGQPVGGALDLIPLVEDVDPAYGSIIQVIDRDISLVLVIPDSLDV